MTKDEKITKIKETLQREDLDNLEKYNLMEKILKPDFTILQDYIDEEAYFQSILQPIDKKLNLIGIFGSDNSFIIGIQVKDGCIWKVYDYLDQSFLIATPKEIGEYPLEVTKDDITYYLVDLAQILPIKTIPAFLDGDMATLELIIEEFLSNHSDFVFESFSLERKK